MIPALCRQHKDEGAALPETGGLGARSAITFVPV
jgi:hypothetical protein